MSIFGFSIPLDRHWGYLYICAVTVYLLKGKEKNSGGVEVRLRLPHLTLILPQGGKP